MKYRIESINRFCQELEKPTKKRKRWRRKWGLSIIRLLKWN